MAVGCYREAPRIIATAIVVVDHVERIDNFAILEGGQ